MLRLRVCALNSIIPKKEGLDARTRNWFTDGYRAAAPGTATCRRDSDCEAHEICQAGYCTGIHRDYIDYGIFYGNDYKTLNAPEAGSLAYLQFENPDGFFYDYIYGETHGEAGRTGELKTVPTEQAKQHGYNYNYNYGY